MRMHLTRTPPFLYNSSCMIIRIFINNVSNEDRVASIHVAVNDIRQESIAHNHNWLRSRASDTSDISRSIVTLLVFEMRLKRMESHWFLKS